jgi:hypothetical protein
LNKKSLQCKQEYKGDLDEIKNPFLELNEINMDYKEPFEILEYDSKFDKVNNYINLDKIRKLEIL